MRYLIVIILLVTTIVFAGCVSENNNTVTIPTPTPTSSTISIEQTTLSNDPVIGTWEEDNESGSILIFKPDGTILGYRKNYSLLEANWTNIGQNQYNLTYTADSPVYSLVYLPQKDKITLYFSKDIVASLHRVNENKKTEAVNISDDEYAVYSSFIAQNFNNESKIIILRTIGESDVANNAAKYISNEKSQILLNETYDNFKVRNRDGGILAYIKLPAKVQLVDNEDLNQIFSDSGDLRKQWENFYSCFPDAQGITSVSRVGFSGDKSQAVLYSSTMRGYLWGSGDLFVFSKINGNWTISETRRIWIS